MLEMTTTQSLALFQRALQGQNYSPKTLRAYGDDLQQFLGWVEKNRVDFDIPARLSRADIEGFMQFLASQRRTGVTRVWKLAAIRKFFTFLVEKSILSGNPTNTVKGAKREEKEPNILFKEQYKALLYEASDNIRDYAIIQTFLQTGIR
jgi:integrase/recombinase XerC